ncbi:MAG: Rrf2 family transcriptional regulator, partial [Candidatus Sigynarchaeota archaeon]
MKVFSKRVDYAIAALSELSKARGKQPLHVTDIAHQQGIPEKYLVQILIELKKKGFLESVRGTNGGYVLIKDSTEIKILDVIEALDGKITVIYGSAKTRTLDLLSKEIEGKLRRMLDI